jgi:hypothetical protein
MKQLTQSYNDGIVNIHTVGNIAQTGNMPKEGLTFKVGPLRYAERTVGMGRFWTAQQLQVKIDRLIRTPRLNIVSSQDVAVLSDGQYKIKQVQYPEDARESMDLSLERLVQSYDIS